MSTQEGLCDLNCLYSIFPVEFFSAMGAGMLFCIDSEYSV